jgi:hypothetical protein
MLQNASTRETRDGRKLGKFEFDAIATRGNCLQDLEDFREAVAATASLRPRPMTSKYLICKCKESSDRHFGSLFVQAPMCSGAGSPWRSSLSFRMRWQHRIDIVICRRGSCHQLFAPRSIVPKPEDVTVTRLFWEPPGSAIEQSAAAAFVRVSGRKVSNSGRVFT